MGWEIPGDIMQVSYLNHLNHLIDIIITRSLGCLPLVYREIDLDKVRLNRIMKELVE